MSRDNVEVIRRIYDATERRDAESVLALYAPDAVWDASRVVELGEQAHHGHAAITSFFREWHGAFSDSQYTCDELIDCGDAVVSVARQRGRGRASGVELERTIFGVWTLREGMIARVDWFHDRQAALEAAQPGG